MYMVAARGLLQHEREVAGVAARLEGGGLPLERFASFTVK